MKHYWIRLAAPGSPRVMLLWPELGARFPLPPHAANDE